MSSRRRTWSARALLDAVVHPHQRAGMHEALAAARDRQSDIAPIDSRHPGNEARHVRFL